MLKSLLSLTPVLAIAAIFAAGCGSPPSGAEQTPSDAGPGSEHVGHDSSSAHSHADHNMGDSHGGAGVAPMDKMKAELAKFSPEDAASAEKQHFCPVSGEMLGTMGPPLKVDVGGRQVWICCEGCRDQLLEDPNIYLAKLSD